MTAHEFSASCSNLSSSGIELAICTVDACWSCVSGALTSLFIPKRPPCLCCFCCTMALIWGWSILPKGVLSTDCGRFVICSGIPLPVKKVAKSFEKLLQLWDQRSYACLQISLHRKTRNSAKLVPRKYRSLSEIPGTL